MTSVRFKTYFIGLIFLLAPAVSGQASAQDQLITAEDIKRIAPRASDGLVDALVAAQDEFDANGINTRLRMAHFLAQVMTETGGLKRLDENMNYSFNSLMRVFSRKTVSEADARRIAGKPVEVANWVYGARLGNRGRDTMDGWNYRGSGYIQLTGRSNFLARSVEIGLDIAEDPSLARDPEVGLRAAIAYWSENNINAAADAHDRLRVRVLVNGRAAHGYTQSKAWFNKVWNTALRDKDQLGFESGTALVDAGAPNQTEFFDEVLTDGGFMSPAGSNTESTPINREEAIRAFQRESGLAETGVVDADTEDAMLDPSQWRPYQFDDEKRAALEATDPNATVVIDFASGSMEPLTPTGFENALSGALESSSGSGPNSPASQDTSLGFELADRLALATAVYPEYAPADALSKPSDVIEYGVIGDDDRMPVFSHMQMIEPPASSVVQIVFKSAFGAPKSCSGAMVSHDTVLTAAHCIHTGTIKGRANKEFVVVPGRNSGSANFGHCDALSAKVLAGWTNATSVRELHDYDLGVIKLDCDIGAQTGWFGVRALEDTEEDVGVVVQGYASDRTPKGMQWFSTDKVRALLDLKGFHQADTFGGTSGAPVYLAEHSDTIIGVHSNTFFGLEEPWKSNNGFTRITPERVSIIQGWIEE